jgi:hypothetical protein
MIKCLIASLVFLITPFVVSCGQTDETLALITEINANKTKCEELAKLAEAKRAEARKQNDKGQTLDRKKSIEEAAALYGQMTTLLNESATKGDKVVSLTTTDWYKDYFTLYSKWTRNLAKLAAGAQEELLVKNNGTPTEDQVKQWQEKIDDIRKEDAVLLKQIAKLETDHDMVPVAHD